MISRFSASNIQMSIVDLPSYSGRPSHSDRTPSFSAPSYSAEPQRDELRIAVADRHRSLPSGNFIKGSKGGGVILRLNAQEDNVELPVYGMGGQVTGTVELSKTEAVQSVEVKVSKGVGYTYHAHLHLNDF